MISPEHRYYGAVELTQLLGITLRQLQYRDEKRIVPARTTGHRRHYDYPAALALALTAELRKKGLSLRVVRQILPKVTKFWTKHGVGGYLVITGTQFSFAPTAEDCIQIALNARQGVRLIDMAELRDRLREAA